MSRDIYTYMDLRTLGQSPYWNKIRNIPQITVTADLRKSLKGSQDHDKVDGIFRDEAIVQACEMRKLNEAAFPKWRADETKFHQTVVLSQFIREQIAKYGDDPVMRRWLVGCRRNLGMILSSIILLEEAEIRDTEIVADGDRNIEFLLNAWRFLQKNDPSIHAFRSRIKELENRSAWIPIFNKLFGKSNIHSLVFHGFYYFTPIQEKILRLLESVGVKVIFLFCYDEKYPYANEIWRKTYSVENGYPDIASWNMERSNKKESYGEIFEGRKAEIKNKLTIKEYATMMEFVHGMKHVSEQGYFIYSSNPNAANKILKDFYPDEYGERKILSYPIGQFVNTLNKMWDEDLQDIVLDEDRLIECFSSGWLAVEGISGKQYMQDLTYILPFFADCDRIAKWEERIELLRQIKEDVVEPFRQNLSVDDSVARWQEIMGNPFLNFSVFSVSDERLDVILKLIKQLLNMARELFAENKTLKVREHIRKLDQILKKHELSNELYEEEREIIKDLFEKLGESDGVTMECFPSDISSALNLYMSGKFNEGEIQNNSIGMVSPIYHVDAACIKQRGKVHVCLCDINNMPGGKKEYVWPLTSRHIKDCYKRTGNVLIKNMIHIMECNYICNRYFMYAALKNQDVQLSWIRDMGDKIQSPSPYIKLVSESTGIKLTPAVRNTITYKRVEETVCGSGKTVPYDLERMPLNTAKEAKMDYSVCPMKYALGYVVEKNPTFQNEFHQNYAINGLIASIYSMMKTRGMTIDEIYKNVIELFPAMRKVEKRQVYDYIQYQSSFSDVDFEGYSELGELRYSDERIKVRFPNKDVRNQAMERYAKLLTPDGQTGMNFYVTAADNETNPYKKVKLDVCLFCQHQDYCRYAVFAVDQEALYD